MNETTKTSVGKVSDGLDATASQKKNEVYGSAGGSGQP